MKLFRCAHTEPATVTVVTSLATPLGTVRFQASIGSETVSNGIPSETARLPNDGWIVGWYPETFQLELLVFRPSQSPLLPQLPNQPPLIDCWAAIWRLHTYAPVESCVFTSAWDANSIWQEGGPDSAQFLYAKTWRDAKIAVTIGTEDTEALARRAEQEDYLPGRIRAYFCTTFDAFDWRTCPYWQHEIHNRLGIEGIAIPLPPLHAGERSQVHFLVAWAEDREQSLTTSLALDRPVSEIIQEIGCR